MGRPSRCSSPAPLLLLVVSRRRPALLAGTWVGLKLYGKLNEAQKRALRSVQEALQRLSREAEKTVPANIPSIKK